MVEGSELRLALEVQVAKGQARGNKYHHCDTAGPEWCERRDRAIQPGSSPY